MTTRSDIEVWFDRGKAEGATHMIIVCDTFDYEDYPVYVSADEDVYEVEKNHHNPGNMSKVMEVYSYKIDKALQMNERRAFHYD